MNEFCIVNQSSKRNHIAYGEVDYPRLGLSICMAKETLCGIELDKDYYGFDIVTDPDISELCPYCLVEALNMLDNEIGYKENEDVE